MTVLLGIAKPIPAAAPPSCGSPAASVGTPITRPWMSASAPPELPGLIGALVWIVFGRMMPPPSLALRPSALTMPWVTLELRPSGLPIAIAMSPTRSFDESANAAGRRPAELGTLITARSSAGNVPTSVPFSRRPFDVVT